MIKHDRVHGVIYRHGPLGWIGFTAYIGAAVYFVQLNPGFWGFILALLKAAVWPAYLLFHILTALHA